MLCDRHDGLEATEALDVAVGLAELTPQIQAVAEKLFIGVNGEGIVRLTARCCQPSATLVPGRALHQAVGKSSNQFVG